MWPDWPPGGFLRVGFMEVSLASVAGGNGGAGDWRRLAHARSAPRLDDE